MNLTAFRVQFPEFAKVPDALVQAHLDAADLEIDAEIWGVKADQGQGYLAAHKLTLSPFGQAARLVSKGEGTTYFSHYNSLKHQVASGFRVI
jgi:hypothetical protein